MPKTRQQKEQDLKNIQESVQENMSTVLATFEGVTVKDMEALRNDLREKEATLFVAKKTLLRKALENAKYEGAELETVKGIIGLATGKDEVGAAKAIKGFMKEHTEVQIVGGFLEGKYLAVEAVNELASLPSREELIAKTVYTIQAPVTGFVNVLQGNIRSLVYALKAISDSKT